MSGHAIRLIPSLLRGMIGRPRDEHDVKLITEAADGFAALIAERDALRTAYLVLAEFTKTAPGRLPERVQAALLLSAEKGE